MTESELAKLLRAALPSTGDIRMECVDVKREPGAGFVATLRLLLHDAGGIRDIKEQDVVVVRRNNVDDARIPLYIAAWAACLTRTFARIGVAAIEQRMPYDLVFPRVLELTRAVTQEDFERAFAAKSRLGKLTSTAP